jgi:hypothetical protein
VGAALAAVPLLASGGCSLTSPTKPLAESTTGKLQATLRVTRGKPDLVIPPDTPAGDTWRYGLVFPFQLAPGRAAAFSNIRGKRGHDFEIGADLIIFDDLGAISAQRAVVLTRNQAEPNPQAGGAPALMVKYPIRGGFVPFGAKRPDGSPHPHAGTGFGTSQVEAWPAEADRPFKNTQVFAYMELQQYSYDGRVFRVDSTERIFYDELLSGWSLYNPGIANAIPDGDDLLQPLSAKPGADHLMADYPGCGSGVVRWRRGSKGWRPVEFLPVTGEDPSVGYIEPTLIRDVDDSLLLAARYGPEREHSDIRIWRSADGGKTWKKIIHIVGAVSATPISINRAADGTPYIGANLYEVFLGGFPNAFGTPRNSQSNPRAGGWLRDKLCLWPLNRERNGVEAPILVRHGREEFGPEPGGVAWFIDHPSAATVQLADGNWHDVLGYRICSRGEVWAGMAPSAPTGAYFEEVISLGPPRPTWLF